MARTRPGLTKVGSVPRGEGSGHIAVRRQSPHRKKEISPRLQKREPPLVWSHFSALTAAAGRIWGVLESCRHVSEDEAGAP